ncbi:hypothetical protein F5Y03DRAFT_378324 [Xylaria venustula]|nr:hypothetical protein F5Y03DRAFT_378324 [Xylaria venustula]
MPSATEGPTVALSFANNFWGKDDAGVGPLLDRMASAKQTSDELRSFYNARASLEDDYARKLLSLSRKSLGSHEMGSLKESLDTVRGEIESMAKQHAYIAAQMKSELEEPLAAFAGGMKERRKIIQNTVEKILKVKIQQTHTVNKTRDRYEQDCLRIKGYLAQGHMVMGQEERKNKAKLEKTQISLASTNAEYEQAVKALEDTTARWNREWKAAADKFQDLEEERLDFSKSSLWTFANLASTVCVSDDSSCEKIRMSLEKMDVEDDIINFINEKGTGQEIPDPPKYINFCRGDIDDHPPEEDEEDNYSVAQFPRSINPAFRTSSPQPSTFESHHDPDSALARDLGHQGPVAPLQPEPNANVPSPNGHAAPAMPPQNNYPPAVPHQSSRPQGMPRQNSYPHAAPLQINHPSAMVHQSQNSHSSAMAHPNQHGHPSAMPHQNQSSHPPASSHQRESSYPSALSHQNQITHQSAQPPAMLPQDPYSSQERRSLDRSGGHSAQQYDPSQFSAVPHDPYPMDGMTMLCRTDGTNSVTNHKAPSRFESMRPTVSSPSVTSRAEAFESVKSSDVPARLETTSQPTISNAVSRFGTTKSPATTSNAPPRLDGLNSATSSNLSGMNSATSSNISAPDDNSDYSNPTSLSSQEPPSGKVSPVKPEPVVAEPEKRMTKKKSGFFQNHSPFRRKSTKDISKDVRPVRSTWGPVASQEPAAVRRPQVNPPEPKNTLLKERTASPDPIDANATLALNVGQNVFPVANTDKRKQSVDQGAQPAEEDLDPIALALAELKGSVDHKQSTSRISADRYHGISTPIPDRTHERTQSQTQEPQRPVERPVEKPVERPAERTQERTPLFSRPVPAPRASTDAGSVRGTPPPSYDTPVQRLGVPPPAVTSKAMQESSRKYTGQTRQMLSQSRPGSVYNSAPSRPATRQADVPRAASPAPPRSASPRPGTRAAETRPETRSGTRGDIRPETARPVTRGETRPETRQETRPETRQAQRSASPNPYASSQHGGSPQPTHTPTRGSMDQSYYQANSPGGGIHSRTASPSPFRAAADYNNRPSSRNSAMAVQLAPVGGEGSVYGSVRSRGSGGGRPGTSSSYRAMSVYDGRDGGQGGDSRQRSRSVADPSRQYTPEGRAILHYARALYMYQAAIPEELGFAKGDILAVLRHQDDGWWEAEIHSGNGAGQGGLVPSNYLTPC